MIKKDATPLAFDRHIKKHSDLLRLWAVSPVYWANGIRPIINYPQ